jgi:MFS family permease
MDYAIFGVIFIFIAIFSFLIWMRMYRRFTKKRSLTFAMIFLAIILPFSMIIGTGGIPLPLFFQGAVYVGMVAFTLAGYMLIPYIIMSDIAHEDELRTGEARAGIYMGFNSIPLNLFQAGGLIISGLLVDIPDFMGYRYFGPILAIFLVLGVLVLQKVKVDFDFSKTQKSAKTK